MNTYDCIISKEVRRAASVHKCDCGKRIEKGERYERVFGFAEHEPFTSKVSVEHIHDFEAWVSEDDLEPADWDAYYGSATKGGEL